MDKYAVRHFEYPKVPKKKGGSSEEQEQKKRDLLTQLREIMCEMRAEAISGRHATHIEQQWAEDEQFYLGVDAASADDYVDVDGATWTEKPMGQPGGGTSGQIGSTLFLNITRPFTDSAAARFGDMLIPNGDDRSFSLKPTPIPDILYINKNGALPPNIEKQVDEELPDPAAREKAKAEIIATETKLYQETMAKAERAQSQIDDWLVECNYHSHVRRCVDQAAQLGTGVLKGPMPKKRTRVYFKGGKLNRKSTMAPVTQWIDIRSCFPDPNCGENIQNGSYHWERVEMSARELRSLAGQPGVHDDELIEVLKEGPHVALASRVHEGGANEGIPGLRRRDSKWAPFEVWLGYASLSPDLVQVLDPGVIEEAARRKKASDKKWQRPAEDIDWLGDSVDVFVMLVNNHVVRSAHNHLSDGEFPYDYFPWQRISGTPWGKGVPRQMRASQRMVVAAVRALMDNAGDAAGLQMVAHMGMIYPADDSYEVTRRKLWLADEDSELDDVRKALTAIDLPMRQAELTNIINLAIKMAEDSTGLPQIMQGQQGSAPETVGGMRILNDNASSVVRRLAHQYDDCVTEPVIRRYYDYLLLNCDDDTMKGDCQIDVAGSASMVERDINGMAMEKVMPFAKDPVYGIDPKKLADQWIKSMRFDSRLVRFDDEQWQQVVQMLAEQAQQAQQGADQAKVQIAQMTLEARAQENEKDRQLEQALKALEIQRSKEEDEMVQALEAIKLELEGAKLEAEGANIQEKIKADLAALVMKLRTQERMSVGKAVTSQAVTPPTEPAGRAKTGEAFQS